VTRAPILASQGSKALPRILPFAIYLSFLAITELIAWISAHVPAIAPLATGADLWLYPLKTFAVLAILVYYWRCYDELKGFKGLTFPNVVLALVTGVVVYLLWVRMDWPWAMQGNPSGYNPFLAGNDWGNVLAIVRLFGAVAVVPLMEELFWRSFLIRYLISPQFKAVPLGSFSMLSFLATTGLFGLEHHLWLAGMVAGAAYTLLLYHTRALWPSIMAHAVTNLLLGLHVLFTHEWIWW
jgi:CAAX prenyl protease-like protein